MTRFFKRTVLFIAICLLLFAKINFAQNTSSGQLLTGDTIYPKHKVMIIPFNMYNYFSDADPELAQKNEKDVTDISTLFRYGLNYNISARVISAYDPYNILVDTTLQSGQDLNMIYASIKYQFEKPMDVNAKDSAANKTIKQPDIFGLGGEEVVEEKKKISFNKKEEEPANTKYMNAVITHPEIFPNLQKKYGTDLFLFINQFELVTNYNHCLDRAANSFERKVVVHYSVYNAEGKQLKGDAITVTFSSAQTNVDEIVAQQFPVIADYLAQSIQTTTVNQAGAKK